VASPPARLTARPAPVSGPPRPLCTSPPLNTASILPIRREVVYGAWGLYGDYQVRYYNPSKARLQPNGIITPVR
jgi:hypothetical protein